MADANAPLLSMISPELLRMPDANVARCPDIADIRERKSRYKHRQKGKDTHTGPSGRS